MTTFDGTPVSQSAADTFAAQARAAGVPEDQIARTLSAHGVGGQLAGNGNQSPAARELAPPAVREDLASSLSPSKTPRLSPSELERGANNLAQHWTGDPAVLRETFERLGLTEVDEADDGRSELARDFDATLGAPASADEYDLAGLMVNRPGLDVQGALEVSTAVRTTLGELGVPKHLGPALGAAILDAVQHSNAVDGVQDDARSNEQVAIAARVLGVGRQAIFDAIKGLTVRLSPESRELLQHAVAGGHQADLLVWLYRAAELQTIRKGLERTR